MIGGFIFSEQDPEDKQETHDPTKVTYVKMSDGNIAEKSSYEHRPEVWAGIVEDCEKSPNCCKCFPLRNTVAAK